MGFKKGLTMKKQKIREFLIVLATFIVLCGFGASAALYQQSQTSGIVTLDQLGYRYPATYVAAHNGVVVLSYFLSAPGQAIKKSLLQAKVDDKEYDIYIGAGTILNNGLVLTVGHLLVPDEGPDTVLPDFIWLMKKDIYHSIAATIIARTAYSAETLGVDDFALLKPVEDLRAMGVTISQRPVADGDVVTYFGSCKGTAFFVRKAFATYIDQALRVEDGSLHLIYLPGGPYLAFSPGGLGDSGGGIYNEQGLLVGMMFACKPIASESYVLAAPLEKLIAFLRANQMDEVIAK